MNQQQRATWIPGVLLMLIACPAWAEVEQPEFQEPGVTEQSSLAAAQETATAPEIPLLSQIEQPATTMDDWLTEIAQSIVQITDVRLNATATGVEIILETSAELAASPSVVGNALIVDIPNAVLALPDGEEFQVADPVEGIVLVSVTPRGDGIRVAITGSEAPPVATINTEAQNLVLNVTKGTAAAETQEDQIQVVVTGEQEEGYTVDDATTATRTDTPLRDIPGSIQVVPRQVIEDQNALRLPDVLRNVSGFAEEGGFGDTLEQFNLRGFSTDNQIFRNGFRLFNSQPLRETANLQRVEVLKGPASVLYGNVEPGGVVNLVTEQPLDRPYYSAELSLGSYDFVRPSIDLSGPLNAEGTVLYRLNGVYEWGDRWRGDFDTNIERYFVAPTLSFQIGERTNLTLDFEYLNDERPQDRGLISFRGGVADIPRDRLVLSTEGDNVQRESIIAGYRFTHQFSENLTLRNAFQYYRDDQFDFRAEALSLNEATGELSDRFFQSRDNQYEGYSLQTDLTAKFTTGFLDHTLLFGVDLVRDTLTGNARRGANGFPPAIDIFSADRPDVSLPDRSELPLTQDYVQRANRIGIFLQDQITFTDNLKLLLGGRFDIVDSTYVDTLSNFTDDQRNEAFSPRVGIVYQPIEEISLYGSFSQSFNPNLFSVAADGSALEPSRATQFEIGIKGEVLDGRLSTTLAAYDITKTNIPTTDPDNSDFSIAVGEVRSRGVELDVIGQILPGWDINASLSYIDAEVTEDNDIEPGTRLANVPDWTGSLWTTYQIQNGPLQGLGFGAGVFYVGEKFGDDTTDPYTVPSYFRTDAALYYRRDNWRIAVNAKNLFDIVYFESGANVGNSIEVGAPFTLIGTFSIEF